MTDEQEPANLYERLMALGTLTPELSGYDLWVLISAGQLAWRHPVIAHRLKTQLRDLIDHLAQEYAADTGLLDLVAMGWDERLDVDSATGQAVGQSEPDPQLGSRPRMTAQRFNALMNGPLHHPLMPLAITRLSLALHAVVFATGPAGAAALEAYCAQREQQDSID